MDENHRLSDGIRELEQAEEAVRELHAGCCQPLRSPRMESLSNTLREAQLALKTADNDAAAATVIVLLEDAGLSSVTSRWLVARRPAPSSTPMP